MDMLINEAYYYWLLDKKSHTRWFCCNIKDRDIIDNEINCRFNKLLKSFKSNSITYLKKSSLKKLIVVIITLDQFSRHIYRNNKTEIECCTKKAVILSNYLFNSKQNFNLSIITERELAFLLMPYKHLDIYTNFRIIKKIVLSFLKISKTPTPTLIRFYKDTIRKFSKKENYNLKYISSNFNKDFSEICDYYPIQFTNIHNAVIIKHKLFNHMENFIKKTQPIQLCVSLSGGVDSMITLFILSNLQIQYSFDVCALHLNYKNRKENDFEQKFIEFYCNRLKIPLFVRIIDEIQRRDLDRTFYEEHTRNIRFEMYEQMNCPIILGHNHDDIIENIWTNLARGINIYNLKKMKEIDIQKNIELYRPLLSIKKKDIYDFSNKYHIAYLKNTTPLWSNRGKFRNNFLPSVEKQYGNIANRNIEYIADTLNEYKTYIDELLFKPIIESIKIIDNGLSLDISKCKHYKHHFWKQIFQHIYHSLELKQPSNKSITEFIKNINDRKISLTGTSKVYIDKNVLYVCKLNVN